MHIHDCVAVVLAGGESKRMGADKASVLLDGKSLLNHVLEAVRPLFEKTVVSVHTRRDDLDDTQVVDTSKARGPMMGVCQALEVVETDWVFVVGCDMPFVSPDLIRLLAAKRSGHDAVVVMHKKMPQPLFAFYARSCLPVMQTNIQQDKRSLRHMLAQVDTHYVSEEDARTADAELKSLCSLDTEEDVKNRERLL